MAARKTLTVQVAELTALVAELVKAQTAPVTQAVAPVKADAPFIAELKLKHAARTETPEGFEPCGMHTVCTRSFRADSKGATNHEARIYAADGTYTLGS